MNRVGGVGNLSSITLPYAGFTGSLSFIPTAVWTASTGGNIGKGSTSIVGQAMVWTFDGNLWWPSY